MMKPPIPENEAERLRALHDLEILDTKEERVFDGLTSLAAYICKTPVALISLIDSDRQWFKARHNLSETETSRDLSFCAHAILQNDTFTVPDATLDARFADNPFVTAENGVRFYAGAPLINEDGYALGTLCVIDQTPREITQDQKEALQALSRLILAQLEFRRNLRLLKEALTDRTHAEHERERELVKLQQTLTRVLGLRLQ